MDGRERKREGQNPVCTFLMCRESDREKNDLFLFFFHPCGTISMTIATIR